MSDLDIVEGYRDWMNMKVKRITSPEVDFGVWWCMNGNERVFPRWRVSWIENTGELYACQAAKDRFILLGIIETRAQVDRVMAGWEVSGSEIYHNLRRLVERVSREMVK